ncbi:ArsR/SmtB family transcription factor [Azospirillum agricola]|uniref:ArsR/SmtB family transcription factor n=1 Tax=Azospirillum agricola TaxID=1720247 RepID=UPI000A0F10D3|nr:helix-turn-helix domain-containing protein [Azospirillum agricola]SMH56583.1 transcriptional regulator, ArsR family [Azospirillum lipoferum]
MNTNRIAEIALLLGEPARAAMLAALMDGRALTATELSAVAGVTPQTASGHLGQLRGAGLITAERQGRHRYHRLAGPEIARLLETVMQIAALTAPPLAKPPRTGPRDAALRHARLCYDHLAGELGVAITDALLARGAIEFDDGAGLVTDQGVAFFRDLGIVVAPAPRSSRPLCRPCLDWSERRPHVAGAVGAALCAHLLERDVIRRSGGSRTLSTTPQGRAVLRDLFGIGALADRAAF